MLTFRMKVQGAEHLAKRYHLAPAAVDRERRRAMEESLFDCEREVVKRTPTNKRSTGGRLRSAIRAAEAKTILVVGAVIRGVLAVVNVPYVAWVEWDTKPHIIRAKHGKALAFSPTVGFQEVWRNISTGRVYKSQEAAGPGAMEQRGRALYRVQYRTAGEIGAGASIEGLDFSQDASRFVFTRTGRRGTWKVAGRLGKSGENRERLVTTPGPSTMIFRAEVHHPGTKGQHMFEEGAKAAWPAVQRRWAAAVARVARILKG